VARRGPILVTGAAGLVGSHVARAAASAGMEVLAPGRAAFDITDPEAVARGLDRHRPAAVINCAAQARVDAAELDPDLAREVNALAPGRLAQACEDRGIRLVHLSTDYVFGGDRERRLPYREDDPPAPLGAYGRTKLEGEERVLDATSGRGLVVRTQWVYGRGGSYGVLASLVGRAARGEELSLADDQVGAPTAADDLAAALLDLLALEAKGVVHAAGSATCTPLEWITTAARACGIEPRVRAVHTADLGRPAPRPAWSVLACDRLAALACRVPGPYPEGVRRWAAARAP